MSEQSLVAKQPPNFRTPQTPTKHQATYSHTVGDWCQQPPKSSDLTTVTLPTGVKLEGIPLDRVNDILTALGVF